MSDDLIKELEELLQFIHNLIEHIGDDEENRKKYKHYIDLEVTLIPEIKKLKEEKILLSTTTDSYCNILAINVIKPTLYLGVYRTHFAKTSVQLELKTDREEGNVVAHALIKFSNKQTTISDLKIISRKGKTIIASLSIDFSSHASKSSATITIGAKTFSSITYFEKKVINLSSYQDAKKTMNTYKGWTDIIFCNNSLKKEDVLILCPHISFDLSTDNTPYFNSTDFKSHINKNSIINEAVNGSVDFSQLSIGDLDKKKKEYEDLFIKLQVVVTKFGYYSNTFSDLASNYLLPGKKGIFGSSYNAQVATNASILTFLEVRLTALEQKSKEISDLIESQNVPQGLLLQVAPLEKIKEQQILILEQLENEARNYQDKTIVFDSFDEYNSALSGINDECAKLQLAWDQHWLPFKKAIELHEATNPDALNNTYYKAWKEDSYELLEKYLDPANKTTIKLIQKIKSLLEDLQKVLDQTGGDGKLEYSATEDIVSGAESKKFEITKIGSTTTKTDFSFEDVGKPLFENGATGEDVQQGQVGDCYLMSALISLTKDNQDLIQDMIVPDGDNYIVTLHKEGIPVEVEVNKNMLIRSVTTTNPDLILIYDKMPAAKAIKDLWVPIIEKAYAKLFGQTEEDPGGDLMKIEGGTSAEALKALLGNKVSTPKKIYLDKNDVITENKDDSQIEVSNSIYFNKEKRTAVEKVIQAANNANYEIHISSPDTYIDPVTKISYKLGDHDVLDIGNGNYMSFNHAYSLLDATTSDVTIRNPHGKAEHKQAIYSDQIKIDVLELLKSIDAVETSFVATFTISDTEKRDLETALTKVRTNLLIKDTLQHLTTNWNQWLKKIIFDSDNKIWIPKNDRQGLKLKLKEGIQTFKKEAHTTADQKHRSKDGRKLRDGFVSTKVKLNPVQKISYAILTSYFQRATISIIR